MRTVEYLESEAEHFNLLPDTLKLSFFLREKNEPCQRSAVALPSPLLSLCKSDSFLKNLLAVPGHAGYRILIPCVCAQSRPTLRPSGLKPARLLCPWDAPGKTTGVGCHFLLQGIFPTHGSNPCLLSFLNWQADSLPQSHLGGPLNSLTRNQTLSPCIGSTES